MQASFATEYDKYLAMTPYKEMRKTPFSNLIGRKENFISKKKS